MNSLCYIISLFSYILRLRFGNRVWRKPRKDYIRTRLYFIYFQTCFGLSGTGFAFDFNQRLFPFFRFRDEKLARSNVRNKQDSNVNVDKVELKCLTRKRRKGFQA